MEYEYEKEEFKRQTETMGIARKVKRGLCWYPVSLGRSYYNSLNQFVVDITRSENKEIEDSFEFGRPVSFFHQSFDGKVKYLNFTATVSYADEERMVVVLPGAGALMELQTDGVLGVQLYFDETSYRAMFEALEDVIRAKGNRLAELRDTLLGTLKPGFRELYPVRFPWLNSTQETAVNKVLCARDVSIVHGPPGTGKTTTLVEAIYETLHREPQVMVCAQSNTAVDWICEKLVDRGVPVLRIGNPTRVNDKMLSFTYERRFESHPAYPELWGIRKSIREMGGRMRRGSYEERDFDEEDGVKTKDPHIWFDVANWKLAAKAVYEGLSKADPAHKEDFKKRYDAYLTKLDETDAYIKTQAESIPKESRVLVTAHDAFQYFARAYGFEVKGLQGVSTATEAGTQDVNELVQFIVDHKIKAIFVESSVPHKTIEAVQEAAKAKGWNVAIGGELYSDSLGSEGTEGGTYIGMVKANIDTIAKALK